MLLCCPAKLRLVTHPCVNVYLPPKAWRRICVNAPVGQLVFMNIRSHLALQRHLNYGVQPTETLNYPNRIASTYTELYDLEQD